MHLHRRNVTRTGHRLVIHQPAPPRRLQHATNSGKTSVRRGCGASVREFAPQVRNVRVCQSMPRERRDPAEFVVDADRTIGVGEDAERTGQTVNQGRPR